MPRKVIVWAHYREPLRHLTLALRQRLGNEAVVRIDGTVKGEEREACIAAFKDTGSRVRVMVAHPRTMGTGQNLGMASYAIYYTNAYSRIQRKQSDERIDRLGRVHACTIADVVARDAPCDTEVLQAHAEGAGFMRRVMSMTPKQIEERMRA
jgi:SNF2 family DNA or RNA helicase